MLNHGLCPELSQLVLSKAIHDSMVAVEYLTCREEHRIHVVDVQVLQLRVHQLLLNGLAVRRLVLDLDVLVDVVHVLLALLRVDAHELRQRSH